ncbi:MAG: threonine aldolase [Nannocystis sp.]|nr:threonine aldolase [Nannocystis sp.]
MTAATHSFRSDNNAGLCPEALAALAAAASGHAVGYGDDPWTAAGVAAIQGIFGDPAAAVFFVATGTAANTLAVAALTEPWQRVLCHSHAHWNDDESTAPERMTMCRTTPISPRGEPTRLAVADVEGALVGLRGDVHQPTPGALTLSNPTEFGTVYRPEAMKALAAVAHARGFSVHVDGARFANAVVCVAEERGCSAEAAARALTVEAGIDALSLGGTKNGLACGEAVVFFGAAGARAAARFPFLRKSSGHLLSKHRFVSAPFAATLTSGAWSVHARQANAMARLLAAGLGARGLAPAFPCEANGVFLKKLPAALEAGLRARGHGFYPFASPVGETARLMCSFDTTEAAVAGFLRDVDALLG